jgi:hypothetical protein
MVVDSSPNRQQRGGLADAVIAKVITAALQIILKVPYSHRRTIQDRGTAKLRDLMGDHMQIAMDTHQASREFSGLLKTLSSSHRMNQLAASSAQTREHIKNAQKLRMLLRARFPDRLMDKDQSDIPFYKPAWGSPEHLASIHGQSPAARVPYTKGDLIFDVLLAAGFDVQHTDERKRLRFADAMQGYIEQVSASNSWTNRNLKNPRGESKSNKKNRIVPLSGGSRQGPARRIRKSTMNKKKTKSKNLTQP